MSIRNATISNSFFSLLTFFCKSFNQIIIFVFLAKILDVSHFGTIGYYITITIITSNIIDFGYRLFLVKHFSVLEIGKNFDQNNSMIIIKLLISFVGFILLIIYYFSSRDSSFYMLSLFFVSGCFISFSNFFNALFQSKNKFKIETLTNFYYLLFILFAILILFYTNKLHLFILLYFLSSILFLIVSCVYFINIFNFRLSDIKIPNSIIISENIKNIIPYSIHVLASTFYLNIDILFVKAYLSDNQLGYYQGIVKIIAGLTIGVSILTSSVMPIISKLYYESDLKTINNYERKLWSIIIPSTFVIVSIYLMFHSEIISLLLSEDYLIINQYSFYIVCIIIMKYIAILPSVVLTSSGKQSYRAFIISMTLFLNIILYSIYLDGGSLVDVLKITLFGVSMTSFSYLFLFIKYKLSLNESRQ